MKGLLKFITCGSVDDGKSTLIGHILYASKLIFADQENALILDSKVGSREMQIDYSLLLDGLMAEREQGITIDVAYRYFNTEKRNFIVADTPGHEEYTRNMAVGASFAELAIILLDATKGILTQTRRHIRICNLMGVRHFVFAINKMDLANYDRETFEKISADLRELLSEIEYDSIQMIPVSATEGDNVVEASAKMPWYTEKPLLTYLEEIDVTNIEEEKSFMMPVQRVCRPHLHFRGFQGQVSRGKISVGEEILILPSKEKAIVKELYNTDKSVESVEFGEAVTVSLDREVDCSRGCVIAKEEHTTARLLRGDLIWMDDEPLVVGRNYLLKVGTKLVPATIMNIHYCVDVNTGEKLVQEEAKKNDIINCDIALSEKVLFESFKDNKELGRFILINRVTHMTSACGVIAHKLTRSDNLTWQNLDITREYRANQKNQEPKTIWFTGLSGSGKSTIANALEKELAMQGKHTMLLDGDNLRLGLNNDLGFTEEDRVENIRRFAEVAKLMNDAGLIVLVSAISPYDHDRQNAREIIGAQNFTLVHVATSVEECIRRDTKNLYQKAIKGEIKNFTGISSPYEEPNDADIRVETETMSVEEAMKVVLGKLTI
ncbi:MAG: adenylyl-sulfate kinase [Eubacteriales bacterium]